MSRFDGISFLVGPGGSLAAVPPPDQLDVDAEELARHVHRSFVAGPTPNFRGEFGLPNHPKLVYDWETVGHTSGMVIWTRRDELKAVSLMLSGFMAPTEVKTVEAAMTRRGLPLPPGLWQRIEGDRRPLMVTLHADVRSVGDMMLATVAPVMAAAFFAMFGTGEES